MYDDLLPLEGRIEVGHDPYFPAGSVGLAPFRGAERKEFGRGLLLAPLAERARLFPVGSGGLAPGAEVPRP